MAEMTRARRVTTFFANARQRTLSRRVWDIIWPTQHDRACIISCLDRCQGHGSQRSRSMTTISPPNVGEAAPWFSAATSVNLRDSIAFDELAGRYIVLFFFGSAARADVAEALAALRRRDDLFD